MYEWCANQLYAHGLHMVFACCIGLLFGIAWIIRQKGLERGIFEAMRSGARVRYTSGFFTSSLAIEKVTQGPPLAQNLPPPALQTRALTPASEPSSTETETLYFRPENPNAGVAIPKKLTLLRRYETVCTRTPLPLQHVEAKSAGRWFPAKILVATNTTQNPLRLQGRKKDKLYRNIFNGEFVLQGDILGILVDDVSKKETEVIAPCSGYLMHFGAFAGTVVVEKTLLFLIAASGEPEIIISDAVGVFFFPKTDKGPTPPPLGTEIPAGTVLGMRRALSHETPIIAPCAMYIVRSYVREGTTIEHNSDLFRYFRTPI